MKMIPLMLGAALGAATLTAAPSLGPKAMQILRQSIDAIGWSEQSCRQAPTQCEGAAARELAERLDQMGQNRERLIREIGSLDQKVAAIQRDQAAAQALIAEATRLLRDTPYGNAFFFAARQMDRPALEEQVASLRGEAQVLESALQRLGILRNGLVAALQSTASRSSAMRLEAMELPVKARLHEAQSVAEESTLLARFFDTATPTAAGPRNLSELLRVADRRP